MFRLMIFKKYIKLFLLYKIMFLVSHHYYSTERKKANMRRINANSLSRRTNSFFNIQRRNFLKSDPHFTKKLFYLFQ